MDKKVGSGAFVERVQERVPDVLRPVQPPYLDDPRSITVGQAAHVALPKTTAEVSALVELANEFRVPVVPYGGGTGLVGGQVQAERSDALVLSLEKMNEIGEVDAVDRTLVAGAGAVLADVQARANGVGLLFPLSLASEGSCRIGGNLATNAGGVNVLRYGNARDLCLGVEAVMPDGSVFHGLKPLRKDNTGYDMRHLLIGSEGTLGIITAARLRLFPSPRHVVTALFDIASPQRAIDLLTLLRRQMGDVVSALELIHRTGIDFIAATLPDIRLPPTGQSPWLVLAEVAAVTQLDLKDRFEATLAVALEQGIVTDGHVAQSAAQRDTIWGMREAIPEGNRQIGAISSHDVALPMPAIPDFIAAGAKAVAALDPALRINCFGHIGDGNLHYNVFPPIGADIQPWRERRLEVKTLVHDLTHEFGGSISAEHGIGRHKKDDLLRYCDPVKVATMHAIKGALDPNNIMNPGAVIDP